MKPKTKIQKEVVELSKQIPAISQKDTDYIKNKVFKEHYYATKKEFVCLNCNHTWKNGKRVKDLSKKESQPICPLCGKKLYSLEGRTRTRFDREYAKKITVFKDYQLVITYFFTRHLRVGKKADWSINTVVESWTRIRDGKHVIMAQSSSGFNNWYNYGPGWNYGGFEVRNDYDKFYINHGIILPGRKIHKLIRRNGYKGNFHKLHPTWFFHLILNKKLKAETLLKIGQINLFQDSKYRKDDIEKYWKQIKIATRNKFIISNITDWFDHIALLSFYEKDICDPKNICPENFHLAHSLLTERRRSEINAENEIKRKKELKDNDKAYRNRIKKFLELKLVDEDLNIKVLPTLQEIKKEGDILKHCVYSNTYYDREDSLLLSARVKKKRTETIEFSLKRMEILQCRGFDNQPTPFHEQIIKLINSNTKLIKQAM